MKILKAIPCFLFCLILKTNHVFVDKSYFIKSSKSKINIKERNAEKEEKTFSLKIKEDIIFPIVTKIQNDIVCFLFVYKTEKGLKSVLKSILLKNIKENKEEYIIDESFEAVFIDFYIDNNFIYLISNENKIFCYDFKGNLVWYNDSCYCNKKITYQIQVDDYIYFMYLDNFIIINKQTGEVVQKIFLDRFYKNFIIQKDRIILYGSSFLILNLQNFSVGYSNTISLKNKEYTIKDMCLYDGEKKIVNLNEYHLFIYKDTIMCYKNKLNNVFISIFDTEPIQIVFEDFYIDEVKFEKDYIVVIDHTREDYKII